MDTLQNNITKTTEKPNSTTESPSEQKAFKNMTTDDRATSPSPKRARVLDSKETDITEMYLESIEEAYPPKIENTVLDRKLCSSPTLVTRHKKLDTPLITPPAQLPPNLDRLDMYYDVHLACLKGDARKLEALLQLGNMDLNTPLSDGFTLPYLCAMGGYIDCLIVLHNHGADMNSQNSKHEKNECFTTPDHSKSTPLCIAAWQGHVNVLKLLVNDLRADVNKPKGNGATPIYVASYVGNCLAIEVLANIGADVNLSVPAPPIYVAAQNGHFDAIQLLIKLGANAGCSREDRFAPVHSAAMNGHNDCIRLLNELGCDINASSRHGVTPVITAAMNGKLEALRLLRKLGGRVDLCTSDGSNPLHVAAKFGFASIVRELASSAEDEDDIMDGGTEDDMEEETIPRILIDINSANNIGKTAMHFAAEGGKEDVIREVIRCGGDVNAVTNRGRTPMHFAADCGYTDCVKLLQKSGGYVNVACTELGKTPIMEAVDKGHVEVVKLLYELGADIQIERIARGNLVYWSAGYGHAGCIKLLKELGIDINQPHPENTATPIVVAAEMGKTDCVELLHKLGASVNGTVRHGCTCGHAAASTGQVDTLRVLHRLEADLQKLDDDGLDATAVAANCGHSEVIEALYDLGVDIERNKKARVSPFRLAVAAGHIKVIETLINLGCEVPSAYLTSQDMALTTFQQEVSQWRNEHCHDQTHSLEYAWKMHSIWKSLCYHIPREMKGLEPLLADALCPRTCVLGVDLLDCKKRKKLVNLALNRGKTLSGSPSHVARVTADLLSLFSYDPLALRDLICLRKVCIPTSLAKFPVRLSRKNVELHEGVIEEFVGGRSSCYASKADLYAALDILAEE